MFRLLAITFVSIALMLMAAKGLQSRFPVDGGGKAAAVKAAPASPGTSVRLIAHDATEIQRDGSGQFHLAAIVNGSDTRFLIDTGADVVALTVDEAQRLGLDADPNTFEPITRTASGVGYGKAVRLDRMEVAGHEIENVEAVVMDGLGTNLLGQSVLRRLGSVELQGDTMVIRTE